MQDTPEAVTATREMMPECWHERMPGLMPQKITLNPGARMSGSPAGIRA